MSEAEILRIQTNLQIVTVLFVIAFLLVYIALSRKPLSSDVRRGEVLRS